MSQFSSPNPLPTVLWDSILSYLGAPPDRSISNDYSNGLSKLFTVCGSFHDMAFGIQYRGFIHGTAALHVHDADSSFLTSDADIHSFQDFLKTVAELHSRFDDPVQIVSADEQQSPQNEDEDELKESVVSLREIGTEKRKFGKGLGRRCWNLKYNPAACHIRLETSITKWQKLLPHLANNLPYLTRISVDCGYNIRSYKRRSTYDEYSSFKVIRGLTKQMFPALTDIHARGLIDETDVRVFLERSSTALKRFDIAYQCSDWHNPSCVASFLMLPMLFPSDLEEFVLPSVPNMTVSDQRNGDLYARMIVSRCTKLTSISYHWWIYKESDQREDDYYDLDAYYRWGNGSDHEISGGDSDSGSDSYRSRSRSRSRRGRRGEDVIDMIVVSPTTLEVLYMSCPDIKSICVCVESIEECEPVLKKFIEGSQALEFMEIYLWKRFRDEVSFNALSRKFQAIVEGSVTTKLTRVNCVMKPRVVLWVFE